MGNQYMLQIKTNSQSMSLKKNPREVQSEISRWSLTFFSQCLRIGLAMQQLHGAKKNGWYSRRDVNWPSSKVFSDVAGWQVQTTVKTHGFLPQKKRLYDIVAGTGINTFQQTSRQRI